MQSFDHYKGEINLSSRHWFNELRSAKRLLAEEYLPRGPEAFESLHIDYHPPTVWRLWIQHNEHFRIMLHRIEPCDYALNHPHPWPSAIEVLSGDYEMAVSSSGEGDVATVRVGAGSQYVMTNPAGWHYVRPLKRASHSIMIVGKPWSPDVQEIAQTTPSKPLSPMTPEQKFILWSEFCDLLGVNLGLEERAAILKGEG